MRNSLTFTIPGAPRGKGRPRFARRGKFITAYTDDKTASFENLVTISYMQCLDRPVLPIINPVKIDVIFFMPIPQSLSEKKKKEAVGSYCIKKPDLDNMLKAILDGLNGNAFVDDNQVYSINASKIYDVVPRTAVVMSWVDN